MGDLLLIGFSMGFPISPTERLIGSPPNMRQTCRIFGRGTSATWLYFYKLKAPGKNADILRFLSEAEFFICGPTPFYTKRQKPVFNADIRKGLLLFQLYFRPFSLKKSLFKAIPPKTALRLFMLQNVTPNRFSLKPQKKLLLSLHFKSILLYVILAHLVYNFKCLF